MSMKAGMEKVPGMGTEIWQQYEQGVDYKTRIGLYRTVDLNERFYSGDQWVGVPHEGLPTPVVNFIKYATAWKVAAVTERRLGMQFYADGLSDGGDIDIYARQVSDYCDMLWERLKMDYVTKEGLKQAAITGDYVQYFYWDSELSTGQAVTGDIATQLIDNVNYYPGNPNTPDVQSQPYIILAFREMVDKVREEAKRNGCGNVDEITADEETEYTAGDRGKVEMDGSGKCNVLIKMYKQDGRVWCEKAVRNAIVQPAKDTKLTRYPVSLMNWETRKNCCHGVAEVTGLIPNQVYINKIMALSQLSQMQMSFPKVVYDRTRIREWTNKVAGAIPVNGDIGGAAQYLTPPGVAYDAWRGLDVTLDKTMRMMGANDVTLGSIRNPDNTSAFIAARDAAMVPLQSHQERFYAFVEDIGQIWLDFIRNFYKGGRMIPIVKDGQRIFVPLPDGALDEYAMRLKVEVGPSTMWSEIQVLQTLDNLLKGGKLTLKQYLERLPDGHIPMKQELLQEIAEMEAEKNGAGGPASTMAPGSARPGIGMPMAAGPAAEMEAEKNGAGGPASTMASGSARPGTGMPMAAGPAVQMEQAKSGQGMPAGAGVMPPGGGGAPGGQLPPMQGAGGAAGGQQMPLPINAVPGQSVKAGGQPSSGPAGHLPPREGSGQLVTILKLVQAGAQSGDVKPEVAQAVGKAVQSGADITEIVEVLKKAAAQGMVSEKFMAVLAELVGGSTVGKSNGTQAAAVFTRRGNETTKAAGPAKQAIESGMGTGAAGGHAGPPLQGTNGNAGVAAGAGAGMAGDAEGAAGIPQSPTAPAPFRARGPLGTGATVGQPGAAAGAQRAGKRTAAPGIDIKRKADRAMDITGVPGMAAAPQDGKAMLEALMALLKEGVATGDVDEDVPEAIGKLVTAGVKTEAIIAALKQASEAGKISPLVLAKAEKLLGGAGAAMEEATDRGKLLRSNRNQLTR